MYKPVEHTIRCKTFALHQVGKQLVLFLTKPENVIALKNEHVRLNITADTQEYEADRDIVVVHSAYDHSSDCWCIEGTITNTRHDLNVVDSQYLDTVRDVLTNGVLDINRTNTRTYHMFGTTMNFDLRRGFPLLTTKKVHTNAVFKELFWFLRGETNIKTLGSKIWDEWATPEGELGAIYSEQWRYWQAFNLVGEDQPKKLDFLTNAGYKEIAETSDRQKVMFKKIDQIAGLVADLKKSPQNRRVLVTAWNPAHNPDTALAPHENAELGMQALPPCHTIWQVCGARMTTEQRLDEYCRYRSNQVLFAGADPELMHRVDKMYTATKAGTTKDLMYDMIKTDILERAAELDVDQDQALDAALDSISAPAYYLDMGLYQRSADLFLGVPFNIASYSLLCTLIAATTNMIPRRFAHMFGNYHVYENHLEQLKTQMEQKPQALPTLVVTKAEDQMADYTMDNIKLVGYTGGPVLRGDVAV